MLRMILFLPTTPNPNLSLKCTKLFSLQAVCMRYFPFTLNLASFCPSSFRLNVTTLEGLFQMLASKGNAALVLFPRTFYCFTLLPSQHLT